MASEKKPKKMNVAAVSGSAVGPVEGREEALVALARQGDYHAFERLFEMHRQNVYRFVYQMMPSKDEAEDITQEAFLRAFQNLHRFRKEAKFTTWILRIATNLCTDRLRMATRRTNLEQREASGALEWMTVGKRVNPVEDLDQEQRAIIVRKALMALPAHHRGVIILRDFEEREYHEIAEILGCSVGGAKLRVLRARRALKDRLAPLLGEGDNA